MPNELQIQALTALTESTIWFARFGLVGLVWWVCFGRCGLVGKFGLAGFVWFGKFDLVGLVDYDWTKVNKMAMIFWNSSFVFLCFFWDLYVLACWCLWKNNVAFRCFCWDCSSFIACSRRSGRRCWLHFEKRQPRFLIFLYFQKRFFSFLFCFLFHLHLLHFENRQSRFLLFSFSFVFSKTSFFINFLLSVSFAFVTFWKASSPFLSFFIFFIFY